MNWSVLIPVCIGAAALIVFLVIRNIKDQKKIVDQFKNDYRKSKDEESDVDLEGKMK
jgi:hypothetical protein